VVLGDCLVTLLHGDLEYLDQFIDARVAAIRLGQFVNLVCGALTKKE
jgi:hypothetical protein